MMRSVMTIQVLESAKLMLLPAQQLITAAASEQYVRGLRVDLGSAAGTNGPGGLLALPGSSAAHIAGQRLELIVYCRRIHLGSTFEELTCLLGIETKIAAKLTTAVSAEARYVDVLEICRCRCFRIATRQRQCNYEPWQWRGSAHLVRRMTCRRAGTGIGERVGGALVARANSPRRHPTLPARLPPSRSGCGWRQRRESAYPRSSSTP